jgi:putative transcriptional regulator
MVLKVKRLSAEQPIIGKLVRELWQAMNLSQEKFADKLSMTFLTINRWENGHVTPSPRVPVQYSLVGLKNPVSVPPKERFSVEPTQKKPGCVRLLYRCSRALKQIDIWLRQLGDRGEALLTKFFPEGKSKS